MNPPVRSLSKKNPATEKPRNSKYSCFLTLNVFHHCICYHFRTKLSQSPMTATHRSLSPVSLRRWNQIGNNQKKVVCRSATVDASPNKSSYLLYLVWRWIASSTPQLWKRSMIPQPEDDDLWCFASVVG